MSDGPPPGHDRWSRDRWSGRIRVTATTVSPLLIVEDRDRRPSAVPQLRVPLAADPADPALRRVDIAPTQIKGMLRAAFEAVTNSRFGVVSRAHHRPLHYRTSASSGSGLRPVVVAPTATGVALHVGGTLTVPGMDTLPGAVLPAWSHDAGDHQRPPTTLLAGAAPHRPPLANGQHVAALVEQVTIQVPGPNRTTRAMARWHVTDCLPLSPGADLEEAISRLTAHGQRRWAQVTGYLHITGPTIKGKQYERLFIDTCVHADPTVAFDPPVTIDDNVDALLTALQNLIDDQRAAHLVARKDEIWQRSDDTNGTHSPWDYLGPDPGDTAWARHLYDTADATKHGRTPPAWTGVDLSPARPEEPRTASRFTCWAEYDATGARLLRLRPVMISRQGYEKSPIDLLNPAWRLRPATSLDDLSPADRVFGWVAPTSRDDEPATTRGQSRRAHRGQLRVINVLGPPADTVDVQPTALVLPILSTPKPTQGRFYLGKIKGAGPVQPLDQGTTRARHFADGQTWRGRKVYLYQRRDLPQRRAPSGVRYPDQPRTQSSELHEWVRPGVTFSFELAVDNLSDAELGALLWLLDPHHLGRASNPDATRPEPARPGRMRLGLGKPHGFGVVEVRLDPDATRLATGADITERFTSLTDTRPNNPGWAGLAQKFEALAGPVLEPAITAVRVAAAGVSGPVHYPRQNAEDVDKGYEWFVANERAAEARAKHDANTVRSRPAAGKSRPQEDRSLPLLHGQDRLSLDPIAEKDYR
ncbi:conserved hypothetical protein [Parafrankia sp. EAN1pec]|nr:conserved hypothetical protein [Frankia sp. EAN1pec]